MLQSYVYFFGVQLWSVGHIPMCVCVELQPDSTILSSFPTLMQPCLLHHMVGSSQGGSPSPQKSEHLFSWDWIVAALVLESWIGLDHVCNSATLAW